MTEEEKIGEIVARLSVLVGDERTNAIIDRVKVQLKSSPFSMLDLLKREFKLIMVPSGRCRSDLS